MRDRLTDLQANQEPAAEPTKKEKPKKVNKQKSDVAELINVDMNVFFEELATLKDQIQGIKGSVDEVKNIHDRALNNVTSEAQNARKIG
jgi:hypothetical protein